MKLQGIMGAAVGLATVILHAPAAHALGYYWAKPEVSNVSLATYPLGFSSYYDARTQEPWGVISTPNPCYLFTSMACHTKAPLYPSIPRGTSALDIATIKLSVNESRKVLWTANRDSNMITLYDSLGVTVKSGGAAISIAVPGGPTGIAYNPACAPTLSVGLGGITYDTPCDDAIAMPGTFNISANGKTAPAFLLIATRAGKIFGWNPTVSAAAILLRDDSAAGADYTGLTLDETGSAMYLADYGNSEILGYDAGMTRLGFVNEDFEEVDTLADANMDAAFAPTNVAYLGGHLYGTFSIKSAFGSEFEVTGPPANSPPYPGVFGHALEFTIAADGSFEVNELDAPSDTLNAPWGMVIAPTSFGPYSQMLYIGNFGDGYINAFNVDTREFVGRLGESLDLGGIPTNLIWIPGIRGLTFERMQYQGPNALIPMKLWWADRLFYGATLNFDAANAQEWSVFGFIRPN